MKIRHSLIASALGALLSGSVWAASITATEAAQVLESRGFDNLSLLELNDGQWIGTATNPDGQLVAVSVNADSREVTTRLRGSASTTTVTTTTTERPAAPPPVVVVEKTVEKPVVIEERVIEPPAVRQEIIVQEKVLVPLGDKIDKNDVVAVLHGAGYHDVHDIDWLSNRGVWKAEARDPSGDDREVHVDPYDGAIVHVEDD